MSYEQVTIIDYCRSQIHWKWISLAASFCVVKVIELLCGETDEIKQPYRYPEDPPANTKNTVIAIHMEISCDSENFR